MRCRMYTCASTSLLGSSEQEGSKTFPLHGLFLNLTPLSWRLTLTSTKIHRCVQVCIDQQSSRSGTKPARWPGERRVSYAREYFPNAPDGASTRKPSGTYIWLGRFVNVGYRWASSQLKHNVWIIRSNPWILIIQTWYNKLTCRKIKFITREWQSYTRKLPMRLQMISGRTDSCAVVLVRTITHVFDHGPRCSYGCCRYVLVYFLKGSLPWQGLKARNAKRKYNMILERKQAISIQQLCQVWPIDVFFAACMVEATMWADSSS